VSLHIVTNAERRVADNLCIVDGTLTFTFLVIFLCHRHKLLTEVE